MTETAPLPLSVLELATVGSGQSTADALAATRAVARAADRLDPDHSLRLREGADAG